MQWSRLCGPSPLWPCRERPSRSYLEGRCLGQGLLGCSSCRTGLVEVFLMGGSPGEEGAGLAEPGKAVGTR